MNIRIVSPSIVFEKTAFRNGMKNIIAVDEVGVGSLAGPVVACAVLISKKTLNRNKKILSMVRDSKLLTPRARDYLYTLFKKSEIPHAIASVHPRTIDKLRIHNATSRALKRAVQRMLTMTSLAQTICFVDGPRAIPNLGIKQHPIVKGDRKVSSIAMASIIAKVHRDKIMVRYAKKYPAFGFEKHKGYGTVYHKKQIETHGPSSIHRLSFSPIRLR